MVIDALMFWSLFAGAAFVFYRSTTQQSLHAHGGCTQSEQLLAERYVRGEIDEEEYRLRLDTLRGA